MSNLKMVLNPSLYVFVAEIESLIAEGYAVDFENNPPCTWGVAFEVGMIKKNDVGAELFATKPSQLEELVALKEVAQQIKKPAGRPKLSK